MTAFARSDIHSVCIPLDSGGCGQTHSRPVLNAKEARKGAEPDYDSTFGVNCQQCEPILLGPLHGWARMAQKVELTPDELEEQERLEKEGSVATAAMAGALGTELARIAREGIDKTPAAA